jgi:ornithine cyclodeaminase/alanine dehydrogenase-like protein (mu-crystallin family)
VFSNEGGMASPIVFTDRDISSILSPLKCVGLLDATLARAGTLAPRARNVQQINGHSQVFGWGEARFNEQAWYGFRCYSSRQAHGRHVDVTTLYRSADGALVALHLGRELSAWRNGAAGAIAVRAVRGAGNPLHVVVLGAGAQAYAQLACIAGTQRIASARVVSRTERSSRRFVSRCGVELSLDVEMATSPIDARRADVIVCATSEGHRLLEPDSLGPRVHVNAIGPKALGRSELGRDVYGMMELRLCDNLAQLAVDWETLEVSASGIGLTDFVALGAESVASSSRSVFLCRGIVGFEIELLAWLLQARADAGSMQLIGQRPEIA